VRPSERQQVIDRTDIEGRKRSAGAWHAFPCALYGSLRLSALRRTGLRLFYVRSIACPSFLLLATLLALSVLPTAPAAMRGEPEVEIVAVGDILLDRGIARRIERGGPRIVFARVRDVISSADLAFGNLECPLTDNCDRSRQRISFRARPRYVEALTDAGFDMLSLANNHSMDCGTRGLLETMSNLKRGGLRWSGAGGTRAEAEAPVILNLKGIRIAFVSFTAVAPPANTTVKDDGSTVALLGSRAALARAVASAVRESEVVAVSLHWGAEYSSRPDKEQVELAHAAVEAGADLVIGHHPHTLAGMELIRRPEGRYALIAYSLGNFAFDSPRWLGKRVTESVILRCKLGRRGLASAEVLPVVLENYLPRPASPVEAQSILQRLSALSAELKTNIENGEIILR
jgi:gamma-polyglutamate biosynthesis protein CapA